MCAPEDVYKRQGMSTSTSPSFADFSGYRFIICLMSSSQLMASGWAAEAEKMCIRDSTILDEISYDGAYLKKIYAAVYGGTNGRQ